MSNMHEVSPEAVERFEQALRSDPSLLGKLLSYAIENGLLPMPDQSTPGVPVEQLLEDFDPKPHDVGFDITAARRAQHRAMLESQQKALMNPRINVTEER